MKKLLYRYAQRRSNRRQIQFQADKRCGSRSALNHT
jgi:hypothetical protein